MKGMDHHEVGKLIKGHARPMTLVFNGSVVQCSVEDFAPTHAMHHELMVDSTANPLFKCDARPPDYPARASRPDVAIARLRLQRSFCIDKSVASRLRTPPRCGEWRSDQPDQRHSPADQLTSC